ncbi:MAG: ribulose-phosphate 3-epimerase, partial [Pseudomonadota bacterium]|nr:ribulose-phosphate 3-epimerase [Pseudomonadota bacterium]
HRVLGRIRDLGGSPSVALNPHTPFEMIENIMDMVDHVLVMTVNPGFGGQSFITSQLEKISELRQLIDAVGRDIELEVDGGVNRETAAQVIAAGANVLVAGTATFKGGPSLYAENIAALRGAGQT